jgi:putative membrane protein (TIGR04086 family)
MRIRWLRIILTALVIEVALLAIAIPLNMSAAGQKALLVVVIPICVIGAFLGGWWAAHKAGTPFVLHGLLVGIAAALIYGALSVKVTLPTVYIVANYLKVISGAAGGLLEQLLNRTKSEALK